MFGFGAGEIIVVGVILFLLFGAKRLPDIGKGLGGAIREFRKVKKDLSLSESNDTPQDTGKPKKERPKALDEKTQEAAEAPSSKKSE